MNHFRRLVVGAGALVGVGWLAWAGSAAAVPGQALRPSSSHTIPAVRTSAEASAPGDAKASRAEMNLPKAVLLGVVEGVTEYLPISSTGHLHVTQQLIGVGDTENTKQAADTFAVVIQAGAILAVLALYHRRVRSVFDGLVGRSEPGRRLLFALLVAFLPAAMVGFVFDDTIKEHLLRSWPIVGAWVAGGVLLLWLARWLAGRGPEEGGSLDNIDLRTAAIIGVAQVASLLPGTSRSLVTIAAALVAGLSLSAAVEFSFLLGLVTLGAATLYEGAKNGSELFSAYGVVNPLVGLVVAGVTAWLAVRWMVAWLQQRSVAVFGWYRLGAAAVTAVLLLTRVIS